MPARRSGAGSGSPCGRASKGMTPAQTSLCRSSGASSGQLVPIFSDHDSIGMLRTMVAASSRWWFGRISATRPGMRWSVNRSSARGTSAWASLVKLPNSTALRYRREFSKADRATMMPLSSVTVRQAGPPFAARRIQPEPVEPWISTRSPSRTTAVGMTSTPPWSSDMPMWARKTSSSRRSSSARSVTARSRRRVSSVVVMVLTVLG
jgi:hypothetical protein